MVTKIIDPVSQTSVKASRKKTKRADFIVVDNGVSSIWIPIDRVDEFIAEVRAAKERIE